MDQIAKTTQSLTTAADMRETSMMLMQPNANWEEYLTPAPLSIAIMGELVFISTCDDFSINKNPPPGGFKHIKFPDSFRACLMQVCNSGWHAFNEAHKNMDQIRIHTATVPDYMKAAVKILFHGSDEVIENLLPNQLENIRSIAEECVTLADGVNQKYTEVINIIQELLEACINAEHFYGDELEKVKMKLEENKIREKTATDLNELSKKAMENMSKQLENDQKQYKKSIDSLPSAWRMLAMDVAAGYAGAMTGILHGITSLISSPVSTACDVAQIVSKTCQNITTPAEDEDESDVISDMNICSKSEEIIHFVETLKIYISGGEINWKELYDQKNKCTKAQWIEKQFIRISENLKIPLSKLQKQGLSLCESGIKVCKKMDTYKPDSVWDAEKTTKLIEKIEKLNDDAYGFDSKSKAVLGAPALTPKPPMMFKTESNHADPHWASKKMSENAHFRIEQSREQLKHTQELYEKSVENMEKNQKELTDILVEMQNCKVKEIDFDTTIRMLVKGLDAMGRVKEQWEKMVRFFQLVSNIIRCSLSTTMRNFVQTADQAKKLSYDGKLFAKDMLYNQAFQASNIASLVHMISGTYTEVSNTYLMDRVSSLGKLMAMDKAKPEFDLERVKLQQSCQEAQKGILQLVLKNKREFEMKTQTRMAKIESGLKAVLPAAAPERSERMKEIVQAGFGSEDGDDDYV
ncbi:uncharacterized protein LOC134067132 [Sardina pilchardus]|uniref:uncharacterized protein LOC134067132 n=1 Tax=Sardina pilchardus TaxID=27697 RepID=UPI002E12DCAD